MTQVGQYAYLTKGLDEPSRLTPFARLYLHPVSSYRRKTDYDLVTSVELPMTPIISCTRIITNGLSGHDPEIIGWFWLVYAKREAFSYFPIDL